MADLPIAFVTHIHEEPAVDLRINFGVLAGREATPAELEELATTLLSSAPQLSIIAENRHEISRDAEAALHQVRVELAHDAVPGDVGELDSLEQTLVAAAERWARACVAERHADVTDL
jgi:hypothetical protein